MVWGSSRRLTWALEHVLPSRDVSDAELDTLLNFAKEGCRTLLLAYKPLTEEEFEKFEVALENAIDSLENREELVPSESLELRNKFLFGCSQLTFLFPK